MTKDVFDHEFCKNDDFNAALNDFLSLRKKMRKPATERAIRNLIKKVIDLSLGNQDTAIKIIDQSITNCWLDFYALKEEYNQPIQNLGKKRVEI